MELTPSFFLVRYFLYGAGLTWLVVETGDYIKSKIPCLESNPLFWPFWWLLWGFVITFLILAEIFIRTL